MTVTPLDDQAVQGLLQHSGRLLDSTGVVELSSVNTSTTTVESLPTAMANAMNVIAGLSPSKPVAMETASCDGTTANGDNVAEITRMKPDEMMALERVAKAATADSTVSGNVLYDAILNLQNDNEMETVNNHQVASDRDTEQVASMDNSHPVDSVDNTLQVASVDGL